MARKSKQTPSQSFNKMDLVSEVFSILPDVKNGEQSPVEEIAAETDDQKLKRIILQALKKRGFVILTTAQTRNQRIPSATTCLRLGYVFTNLMPDIWLLTTIEMVKRLKQVSDHATT